LLLAASIRVLNSKLAGKGNRKQSSNYITVMILPTAKSWRPTALFVENPSESNQQLSLKTILGQKSK
jgi:hypothetical protein